MTREAFESWDREVFGLPDRYYTPLYDGDFPSIDVKARWMAWQAATDAAQAQFDKLQAQLVRQQASYEAEIKVEVDAALERAAAEVVLLDKKHWFSKQSRFAEFLAYAIRALKESKE